tara:strand:+ start:71 stop:289 length:219 start_codon:yes stop_codon:yes gene_type:complete
MSRVPATSRLLPPLDAAAAQGAARALTAQVGALLASGASVDEHTADQLIVYMALAEGTSKIRAPPAGSCSMA